MSEWACPICSKPVPERPGRGRPKTYCSNLCRRRMEHRRQHWDVVERNREYLKAMGRATRLLDNHPSVRP